MLLPGVGCPSGSEDDRDEHRVERSNLVKFGGICGWEGWGKARSTQHKANPRIQTNKISTHQQITKKIGAILVGNFRIRTKINKTRLERQRGGSEIVINVAHDTKMM